MRLARRFFFVIFLCLISIVGCVAKQTTAFRKFDTTLAESVAIDAKQRVILVARKGDSTMFCAEPSPDALAAIGASLAASGQYGGTGASLQAALAESARSFGVRNATIQLLRDGLYRLCEAHINGAIEKEEYKRMANKYEDIMVTLLAIEKLTSIADQSTNQNLVLTSEAGVKSGEGNDQENGKSNPDAKGQQPTVAGVMVSSLSDKQIEIISQTVEKLVHMMFDYWRMTYSYPGVGQID